jgi:hypothetical protein
MAPEELNSDLSKYTILQFKHDVDWVTVYQIKT